MADDEGFRDFVVARRRSLLRTAWLLTGDWYVAEDLVQAALAKCYPHWRRIATDNPDGYIRRVIFTLYVSWWRRRWRSELPTANLPEQTSERDPYTEVDERRLLFAAMAGLPPRQRAVIVLRFYEDMSETDTAVVLGCAVGTVKSQTAKALAHLRDNAVLLSEVRRNEVLND